MPAGIGIFEQGHVREFPAVGALHLDIESGAVQRNGLLYLLPASTRGKVVLNTPVRDKKVV